MKRTSLLRKVPIVRARKRIRARNPERAAKAKARDFGAQADLCRALPCVACWGPDTTIAAAVERLGGDNPSVWCGSDPHHEPPRSCGGRDRDTVPLCRIHHERRHTLGVEALEADVRSRIGVREFSLRETAARLADLVPL